MGELRHLLEVDDLSADELHDVLQRSLHPSPTRVLEGKGAALVFQKPSARTRNSTEMAVVQLGGHPVAIRSDEVSIDVRESAEDVARTLAGYHDLLCARVFGHDILERMAAVSSVPVVNLLSDDAHPLQAVADLLTIQAATGGLEGRTVAYVGDGNNVLRSLALAGALVGVHVRMACPPGYRLSEADLDRIRAAGGDATVHDRPEDAVVGADVIYTDVWASMGREDEAEQRRRAFEGFTIDDALLARASQTAIFLHCLPAHRGEEVSGSVVDGPQSRIWEQAENRMHAARGALWWLVDEARAAGRTGGWSPAVQAP
jgi:ornithine carbamoyltransferase